MDRLRAVAVHPFGRCGWVHPEIPEPEDGSPTVELILTRFHAHLELLDRADLVIEMRKVKLPFERRIDGRQGIEL